MNNLIQRTAIVFFAAMSLNQFFYVHQGRAEPLEAITALEEVIVTARKREETIQNSPIAVTALATEALREAGIEALSDLSDIVPGLRFADTGNKAATISIRGIGLRENTATLDPGVGVYINGIYIPRVDAQLLDTVDTQSIQVLRGPQGTLFGKNNTGGALLITTQEPNTDKSSVYSRIRLGNFGRLDGKFSINIPLIEDSLAFRIGFNSVKRDGYIEDDIDWTRYGDEQRLAVVSRIRWEQSDSFSMDAFLYWSKQNERNGAYSCKYQNDFSNLNILRFPGQPNFKEACQRSEVLAQDYRVVINSEQSQFDIRSQLLGLTMAWDFDEFEIKSITSWGQQDDINISQDQDGSHASLLQLGTNTHQETLLNSGLPTDDEVHRQVSQELQIVGYALDENLSYTAGVFASDEQLDDVIFSTLVGPNGYGFLAVPVKTFIGTQSDFENKTYGVYGQASLDFLNDWQLTIGSRYSYESRLRNATTYSVPLSMSLVSFEQLETQYTNGTLPPLDLSVGNDEAKKSWKKFTPMSTLSYKLPYEWLEGQGLDSALFYLTFSKGFKSGGFEPRGSELVMFEPEKVENIEFGFKLDGLDQRLRLNVALYRMDYEDIQLRIAEQGPTITDIWLYLSNAGRAVITGAEAELTILLSEGLTLQAIANYTKGDYRDFVTTGASLTPEKPIPAIVEQNRVDEEFLWSPRKTLSVVLSYQWFTRFGVIVPRLMGYYRDEMFIGLDHRSSDFDSSTVDAVALYNARLSWILNESIMISAYCDNLTDKHHFSGGGAVSASVGAATPTIGEPRVFGIEASYQY